MHPAQLHDAVYAVPGRGFKQNCFFLGITDTESERLQRPIKPGNGIHQIVHDEQRERSSLGWFWHL